MATTHPQTLVTCCVPVRRDRRFQAVRDGEIDHLLDGLGNPLCAAMRDALDATGRIHFMSLVLVRGELARERSWLVLELSGDGKPDDLVDLVVEAVGGHLLSVFARARGLASKAQLRSELRFYRKRLHQWIPALNILPRACVGANFIGGPGLSVARIRLDRELFDLAEAVSHRAREDGQDGQDGSGGGVTALIETVRNHIAGKDPLGLGQQPPRPGDAEDSRLRNTALRERIDKSVFSGNPPVSPLFADRAPVKISSPVAAARRLLTRPVQLFALLLAAISVLLANKIVSGSFFPRVEGFQGLFDSLGPVLAGLEVFILAIAIFAAMAGAILLGLHRALRRSEAANLPDDRDPDPAKIAALMLRENHTLAQNHMVSVTRVIDTPLRRAITLPGALGALVKAIRDTVFPPGFLADIGTIHFARWIMLPGSNRLVFLSNYDGNWESYLEDFISKAAVGLTGVWSNCEGFPETRNLFEAGATDGDRFKRWARRSMIATRAWYSAYPDLTMGQIRKHALIRDGLVHPSSESHARAWRDLFDGVPRPSDQLETGDIQTLLLTGLRHHHHSACLVIGFPERVQTAALKRWLKDIQATVTTGPDANDDIVVNIALSGDGLARLGLAQEVYGPGPQARERAPARFPSAFSLGMADASRARMLGDINENAPQNWQWGQAGSAQAVVMIYARALDGPGGLAAAIDEITTKLKQHGLVLERHIQLQPLPERGKAIREPFGYVDGISQPRIRGLDGRTHDVLHTVEPGEFILGYTDNRGFIPPSLLVPAARDPEGILPLPAEALPGPAPDFGAAARDPHPFRDLGRNGSFLVIRQLEQDVSGFHQWVHTQTNQLRATGTGTLSVASEELVYAKLLGRWRTGHSLVNTPDRADGMPDLSGPLDLTDAGLDSDFRYAESDLQGHACPLGAHIRRANPRDSLDPDSPVALDVSNRHRLLRRGRSYVDETPDADEPRTGTFFLCLNGDIERQFEFVQTSWLNASGFHGLSGEIDPIAGQPLSGITGEVSLQSEMGAEKLANWHSFIRLRGGGYYFLPGREALRFLST